MSVNIENLYKINYPKIPKIAKTILTSGGKRYYLLDEIPRTKLEAQKFAVEIRENGKIAIIRPITCKYMKKPKYFIYQAEKFQRN